MDEKGGRSGNEMEQIQRGLEAFLEKEIEVIDVKGRTPAAEGVQQRRGRPEGAGGQPGKDSLPKGPGGQKGGKASGQPRQQRYRNMAGELLEWDLSGGALDEEEDIEEQEAGEGDGFVGPEDLQPDEWDAEEEDSEDWDCVGGWNMRQGRPYGEPSSGIRQPQRASASEGASYPAGRAYSAGESSPGGRRPSASRGQGAGTSARGRRPEGKRAEEGMPRKRISGERMSGEGMPGERISGERISGERMPREKMSGERMPSAKKAAGKGPRGNKSDRKKSAVKQVSGKASAEESMEESMAGSKRNSAGKPPKKKGSKLMAKLCRLLIAVAVIMALVGFGLYQLVGFAYGKMTFREVESMASLPMKEQGVVNILLIGNDSRENGEDGRSDAMILLSISDRTKKIYMTSLLRDIYVEIPGYDNNRLNAAYSFGGAELLMKTIEKNFDIPVHRYMLVNFEAFAGLVDAVGGVDLELTTDEIVFVNGYLSEYNRLTNRPEGTDNMDVNASGLVHLNGPQALAYSRNRYIGTDFGRTERQRKVLTEVIGKLPKAVLTNAGGLIDGLMSNLTTNLTQFECFRLSLMAGKLLTYEIVSDSIPQPGAYNNATIRNMAVLELDFQANIAYLKEKIYGE